MNQSETWRPALSVELREEVLELPARRARDLVVVVGVENDTVVSVDLDGSAGGGTPVVLMAVLDLTLDETNTANFDLV